jgi:lysylphosphatidylglycerol synthetase-like protein (DUF2156 family)
LEQQFIQCTPEIRPITHDSVPLEVRQSLLRRYGSFSQAYSAAFQPGLLHFGDEHGFVAHKMVGRTALALSDPIAPAELWASLIFCFVEENNDACFWHSSRAIATILNSLGFFVTEIGPDTRIDLTSYDFRGQKKKMLRNAINHAETLKYTIKECSVADLDRTEMQRVYSQWRRTRTVRREIIFPNRPIMLDDEPDVRKIFAFDDRGNLMAFAFSTRSTTMGRSLDK